MAKRRPRIAPRKPGAREAVDAQRFVESGKTSGGTKGHGYGYARADGRELARVVSYIQPQMKKRLDIWCVENDITVSDQIAELLTRFMADK